MTYIFDFDGTLVDSMPVWAGAHIQALKDGGIPCPDDFVKTITPLGNIRASQYAISLGLKLSLQEYLEIFDSRLYEGYNVTIPLKSNVAKTLEKLKRDGHSLNVLTASPHKFLDPCLKRLGIFDLFQNVWSIDDFGHTKSETILFEKAAEMLNTVCSDCIFVDDNLGAVETAKKSGMKTVAIYDKSSDDYVEDMKKIADLYVYDFYDITK